MVDHTFAVMAYKDSPYLYECLFSLKNQTVESHIYIATSTPSVFISDIAKKYGVDVYVSEPGRGIAHDWNFAFNKAKSKYFTLAHQDDLYMPQYVEHCVAAAEKYKDSLISFTGYAEVMNGKDRSNTLLLGIKKFILWFFMPYKKNICNKFCKRVFLSIGNPISAPSVMYNQAKLNGFQFSPEFTINMDWDAWLRMAGMEGRFVYINKMLMKHRIHSDSATTKGLEACARQNEDLKMYKRFWPTFVAKLLTKVYVKSYESNNSNKSD